MSRRFKVTNQVQRLIRARGRGGKTIEATARFSSHHLARASLCMPSYCKVSHHGGLMSIIGQVPDSPPDMVGSCLVCFQGVSGCRPGVRHDMIGHRTGSRAPSLRVSAAVRCQLWLLSVRRRHGPAWQLGRVAYKPMLQAGSLCSIRLGSQRQYPLPRPEQQLV